MGACAQRRMPTRRPKGASSAPRASCPTKVDRGLLALALAGIVGAIASLVLVAAIARSSLEIVWVALDPRAIVGLVIARAVPTLDELDARELVVRSAMIRDRFAYGDLATLEPSSRVLSSPAWSLDRVELSLRDGRIILRSPVDPVAFARDLATHAPELRRSLVASYSRVVVRGRDALAATISTSTGPAGFCTVAMAPIFLPMTARPRGDFQEISPASTFSSSSPTRR